MKGLGLSFYRALRQAKVVLVNGSHCGRGGNVVDRGLCSKYMRSYLSLVNDVPKVFANKRTTTGRPYDLPCKVLIKITRRITKMDFETFIQSLFNFIKNCDNAYFLAYAVVTCLATQLCKKLFVNKVDVDILHKFDFAVILPFVFGAVCAVVDAIFVKRVAKLTFAVLMACAVDTATIGALATVIFKFVSSLSGKSMKSILKDDLFGAFYTQILYFGSARQKLLNKEMTLADFVASVKLVCQNAQNIYAQDIPDVEKRYKLANLLNGIIDDQSIGTCIDVLDKTMQTFTAEQTDASTDQK